jgi:hypothetical protein
MGRLPMRNTLLLGLCVLLLGWCEAPLAAQPPVKSTGPHITSPKEHLGFNLGDDYCLANYQQLMTYWTKLENESPRLKVVKMGMTEEGRPQLMGIVTSPANHQKLDHYKAIARKLALAEGVDAKEAAKLAAEGKAVIWLDGGLHASEVLCAQVLMETLYQYLVATDAESLRILDDVIILFVHCNPDGMDLVADHYMSNKDPKKRTMQGLPRLYQKYIGHDNNRDFYANTQAETKNMNRVMYREWFPQIVYNHHQTGPAGTVVFIPPCRDPFDYNIDPLVINGIEAISANMVQRYLREEKPGATVRTGARYSTWFNGGLSTACQFHNMIGLFTETVGGPTPSKIPYLANKLLPNSDYLAPIQPQEWHFRQSMDYSVSGNKSILDYASRNREHLLYNIWRMGKNSIERGGRDSWTVTPKMVEAAGGLKAKAADFGGGKGGGKGGFGGGKGGFGGFAGGKLEDYEKFFHDPGKRDPRGFIVPSDQADFLTATKFINTLIGTGVKVHRATADFVVGGKNYPKGSYVVKCAQAFRPHVLDMFEPQDHPNDIPYPGAAPTPPYDAAGWTLAFQMGVKFDRILDGFSGPFEELKNEIAPPPGRVTGASDAAGFFLDTRVNDSFRAVNRLLAAGVPVSRLQEPFMAKGTTFAAGSFFIPGGNGRLALLEKLAAQLGTSFVGSAEAPGKEAMPIKQMRVALWDRFGGSMTSGWTRWILERFEYPFKVVLADELAKTDLQANYDVVILVEDAGQGGKNSDLAPQLRKFVEAGGTLLAIGPSANLGREFGLPLPSQVATKDEDGNSSLLPRDKYYIPSSVLRVHVNTSHPLAWGVSEEVDVMFSNSPTYKWADSADSKGMTRVAWFDTKTPLRSGWALGQHYLEGGTAMIEARVGKGRVDLFGPHILYRGQSHGTFKFLFNGIVQAGVRP